MNTLKDKVAVVTGSSQGIGAAIAVALAAEGAAVIVNYLRNEDGAAAVVAAIKAQGGQAMALAADVSQPEGARALVDTAVQTFGRLDILVNNAGVYAFSPLEAMTVEGYRKLFDTNVLGVLLTTQAAVPHMVNGGSIINVGSNITEMTLPASSLYAGTKAAVESISRVLSKELGAKGIRVNCVLPGPVDTETSRAMGGGDSEQMKRIIGMTPLGRIGEPGDVAAVAAFLAGDNAGWVTGANILASGGL